MLFLLCILAWIGAGMLIMPFAVEWRYSDKKFLRFIARCLFILFIASFELYIAIQNRSAIDKSTADNYRTQNFPVPETYFEGRYLTAIKNIGASEKEIYFACKMFVHIKKTSFLFSKLEKMHYNEVIYSGDDGFLYKYHYPAELSVRRVIDLLLAFPATPYQVVALWQSDVIAYGDKHFYMKVEEITNSEEIIANMKRGH